VQHCGDIQQQSIGEWAAAWRQRAKLPKDPLEFHGDIVSAGDELQGKGYHVDSYQPLADFALAGNGLEETRSFPPVVFAVVNTHDRSLRCQLSRITLIIISTRREEEKSLSRRAMRRWVR